jgi:urease accessory protein
MVMGMMGKTTIMIDNVALLRLMTWLSPAFPVGAFSYSHGIERAVHDGLVVDRGSLHEWLVDLLGHGSAWNDAVLFAGSYRLANREQGAREQSDWVDICELAEAMAGSSERHMETMLQGEAFLAAARAWPHPILHSLPSQAAMPVAVGALAGAHRIDMKASLSAYLHSFVANLVQGAIRLVPLGQKDGVAILAGLEHRLVGVAERGCRSSLADLGSAAIMSEIMAMRHETQYSRIFRS